MYMLHPNESINDHVKESITMLNEMAKSIHDDYFHGSTMIRDIEPDSVRFVLDHIRVTIQMLDELTDELEDDKDKIRQEYEEKAIQFFSRLDQDVEYFRELEEERERSNQLEKRCSELTKDRDSVVEYWEERTRKLTTKFELAKKFLHMSRDEVSRLKEELRQTQLVKDAQKKVIDEKVKRINDLHHEIWELQEQVEYWEDLAKKYADPDGHKLNNPANFCGNCANCEQHPNDVYICKHYYKKVVDPDDASCPHFKPNNGVVVGKPEFPCCDHCNHEDCDDCTLCPF